ncbi:MAG: radical SAM family heme chaperone HemW [Chloroflexi bacterium]|nr:radical SAM family heme chaperone HemW [Chloroflexota bacterium]
MENYSLYFHIPYCRRRCGYCDFNTTAGMQHTLPFYWQALLKEVRQVAQSAPERLAVHTIFFGGGTPSLVPVHDYTRLFTELESLFDFQTSIEITLEANPGTVSPGYLKSLREIGFNRISFGAQSARTQELALLDRDHQFQQVIEAVGMARAAGFDNLSLDLIYGLPDQTVEQWLFSVECAAALRPEHLSLYALTVEDGTRMERMVSRGLVNAPEDDTAADMYEAACAWLQRAGYRQYEISNWKLKNKDGRDLACRHNLQYWILAPYLGFGAGAHGFAAQTRTANVADLAQYIRQVSTSQGTSRFPQGPATLEAQELSLETQMGEFMMVGLRLTEVGVSPAQFRQLFQREIEDVFGAQVRRLLRQGLVEQVVLPDGEHLRLTEKGRLLGNQVFMQFVGED